MPTKHCPCWDRGIQLLVPGCSLHGPARTVIAVGDYLPVLTALALAQPGEVLVVSTERSRRAVRGELFATEAGLPRRRGRSAAAAPRSATATSSSGMTTA
jgi:regulator of RNase E activity RraA